MNRKSFNAYAVLIAFSVMTLGAGISGTYCAALR